MERAAAELATGLSRFGWGALGPGGDGWRGQLGGVSLRVRWRGAASAPVVDEGAAVALIEAGGHRSWFVAPAALLRPLTWRLLGGPEEAPGPRPATSAEQATCLLLVGAILEGAPASWWVEPADLAAAADLAHLAAPAPLWLQLAIAIDEIGTGNGWLRVPRELSWPRRGPAALADLASRGGDWLDLRRHVVPVVVAAALFSRYELRDLKPRDVLLLQPVGAPGAAVVQLAGGSLGVELGEDQLARVTGAYCRGTMDENLGDDLLVPVAASVGTLTLSTRQALELAPGQVLTLARPTSLEVELLVADRVIARGELIDVEGQLGIRIVAIGP
jgi:hypothetical protein